MMKMLLLIGLKKTIFDRFQFIAQQKTSHPDEFSQMIETDAFDKSEFAGEGLWTSRKQKNIM